MVFALISLKVVQNPKIPTRAPPIFILILLSRSHRAWPETIIMRSDIIFRAVQFGVRTIFKVRGLTRTFTNFEKRGSRTVWKNLLDRNATKSAPFMPKTAQIDNFIMIFGEF